MIHDKSTRKTEENSSKQPILTVKDLDIEYETMGEKLLAVEGVSFNVWPGEAFSLVGESGSGKSTIAFAIMRYLASNADVPNGKIIFRGKNIFRLTRGELLDLRGMKMSLVPQDPLTSLNPSHRVANQIAEIYRIHLKMSKKGAYEKAIQMLVEVNMPDPYSIAKKYPHEISGGQQQRILIAMAFSTYPDLLIMDEPTTGLDVTTESVILDLIDEMKIKYRIAILYITHNLGVVHRLCDKVSIIYAGRIVEMGGVKSIFYHPFHPYTLGLLRCIPRIHSQVIQEKLEAIEGFLPDPAELSQFCIFGPRCPYVEDRCRSEVPPLINIGSDHFTKCFLYKKLEKSDKLLLLEEEKKEGAISSSSDQECHEELLEIIDLKKVYKTSKGDLRAVDGVSFKCWKGEILGIVGESGCGKTTLARCIIGLVDINNGKITFNNKNIGMISQKRSRELCRKIQMVFQNPEATLNPQKTVEQLLTRPLALYNLVPKKERRKRVIELLESVKLGERYLPRYPHEISGGEKQRIGIARAFATNPELIICDEPISSLDVSVQAGIINLLIELQKVHKISYMFIGHDLNVIRHLSNRIIVMYMGMICEVGTSYEIFEPPYHPYTEALLSAVPVLQPNVAQKRIPLAGAVPSPIEPVYGCVFHTRCPRKIGEICTNTPPPEIEVSSGHKIYCHIPIKKLMIIEPVFTYMKSIRVVGN